MRKHSHVENIEDKNVTTEYHKSCIPQGSNPKRYVSKPKGLERVPFPEVFLFCRYSKLISENCPDKPNRKGKFLIPISRINQQ